MSNSRGRPALDSIDRFEVAVKQAGRCLRYVVVPVRRIEQFHIRLHRLAEQIVQPEEPQLVLDLVRRPLIGRLRGVLLLGFDVVDVVTQIRRRRERCGVVGREGENTGATYDIRKRVSAAGDFP